MLVTIMPKKWSKWNLCRDSSLRSDGLIASRLNDIGLELAVVGVVACVIVSGVIQ
jgi:hypothetical protein